MKKIKRKKEKQLENLNSVYRHGKSVFQCLQSSHMLAHSALSLMFKRLVDRGRFQSDSNLC